MSLNPLADAMRSLRATSNTNPHNLPREPLGETELASEIARILERPRCPSRQSHATGQLRWLGDEADQAFVDSYALPTQSGDELVAFDNLEEDPEAVLDFVASSEVAVPSVPTTNRGTSAAAQWARKARRARLRRKLRNAAGWTVSFGVSLLLIAIAGLTIYGWPNEPASVRQMNEKSLTVSTNLSRDQANSARDNYQSKTADASPDVLYGR